jgi:hypothetical protein
MASDVEVRQFVTARVATQSVEPPAANVTVPVASAGNPVAESVSALPNPTLAGAADSVNVTLAFVMVIEVVAVWGAKLESPEYDAVTASVPIGALVAGQLSVGSVAVQSVVLPVVKTTVPVVLDGSVAA